MSKPNILCINPWIYDFAAYDFWSKPLGLLYIAAYLRQFGLNVEVLDCLDKWHPDLLRRQNLTSRGIARFFLKCEAQTIDILLHAVADMQAKKEKSDHDDTEDFIRFVEMLIHRYYSRYLPMQSQQPLITGKDLIQILHLTPSPLFKTILSRVEESRLSGHVTDKQGALRLAKGIAMNAETTS